MPTIRGALGKIKSRVVTNFDHRTENTVAIVFVSFLRKKLDCYYTVPSEFFNEFGTEATSFEKVSKGTWKSKLLTKWGHDWMLKTYSTEVSPTFGYKSLWGVGDDKKFYAYYFDKDGAEAVAKLWNCFVVQFNEVV